MADSKRRKLDTSTAHSSDNADGASMRECTLRIFHVNDVYTLEYLPVLKTAIATLSEGIPNSNVLTTLSGDFLAPSLLSSLDNGRGMVDMMNDIPIKAVCFGNHEADVPYEALVDRISEFKGVWLNSNMLGFEPKCPENHLLELEGGRRIGLIGLNVGGGKDRALYRNKAFNGFAKKIVPVLDAVDDAVDAVKSKYSNLDAIIPLTHQSIEDDRILAERNPSFPIILGGHDHFEVVENDGNDTDLPVIVKAGANAKKLVVIDVIWPAGAPHAAKPNIKVRLENLKPNQSKFKADEQSVQRMHRWMQPVEELKQATMYVAIPKTLSSKGSRIGPCSMATFLTSCLRDAAQVDIAVLNSGAVRADKIYETGIVTYADLTNECPFPSQMLVINIDGSTLSDAVQYSRRPWTNDPPEVSGEVFHVDDRVILNRDFSIHSVLGKELVKDSMYELLVDAYMVNGNPVIAEYAKQYPERIPHEDSGKATLALLVQYFIDQIWISLMQAGGVSLSPRSPLPCTAIEAQAKSFLHQLDQSGTGFISPSELKAGITQWLGPTFSSNVVTSQCMTAMDKNGDNSVSVQELKAYMIRKRKKVSSL